MCLSVLLKWFNHVRPTKSPHETDQQSWPSLALEEKLKSSKNYSPGENKLLQYQFNQQCVLLLWKMRAFLNPPCKNDLWEEEVTKELNYPVESKLWFVGSTGNKRSVARCPSSKRTWLAVGISMKAVMWFISFAGPSLLPPFPPHHH